MNHHLAKVHSNSGNVSRYSNKDSQVQDECLPNVDIAGVGLRLDR